jgi:hypothetical protein
LGEAGWGCGLERRERGSGEVKEKKTPEKDLKIAKI